MSQRAILCPRCRRLIGSEEKTCSWCGTSRSAAWWQFMNWTRGAMEGDWLVKSIITANVLYYAISLILSYMSSSGGILSPGDNVLLALGATGTIPINQFGRFWTLVSANY